MGPVPRRDPQGNVLATYERRYIPADSLSESYQGYSDPTGKDHVEIFALQEYALYGSQRLGLQKDTLPLHFLAFSGNSYDSEGYFSAKTGSTSVVLNTLPDTIGRNFLRGEKFFELSNHLGNVLAVVSDRKLQVSAGAAHYFTADLQRVQDYYAFGMTMPGRTISLGKEYRYGFQGQETDEELYDGAVSYKYRVHDPRLGRFMSLDPLAPEYPWNSPYAFAINNPIIFIDILGLGVDDPSTHVVQEGETLTSIGSTYGVSVDHLVEMNNISDPNLIFIGQELHVNPEVNFSGNPMGKGKNNKYQNPSNASGTIFSMPHITSVGFGFAFGKGTENMIVEGEALNSVRQWTNVSLLGYSLAREIMADGIAVPGESYEVSSSSGNIPEFLGRFFRGEDDFWTPVHVLGSFAMSARVNADGNSITYAIYDRKTAGSLLDNQFGNGYNQKRDDKNPKPFTTQFVRFIWEEPIPKVLIPRNLNEKINFTGNDNHPSYPIDAIGPPNPNSPDRH